MKYKILMYCRLKVVNQALHGAITVLLLWTNMIISCAISANNTDVCWKGWGNIYNKL